MNKNRLILVFLVLGFTQLDCLSQNNKIQADSLTLIDSYFKKNINEGKLAGAITLIAENGKIQHLKAYGYKDIIDSVAMDTDLLIPIASMTKVITSIAILQLHEKGDLNIDDPIEKYIPDFKDIKVLEHPDSTAIHDLKTKLTIRDFLRHTSGMVYSGGKSFTDKLYKEAGFREWNDSLALFVKKVTEIPLAFQPNSNWRYSYSHDVLGYLVEIVSGNSLNDYCMNNISQPLGLQNTDFYVPKSKSDKLSDLYEYKDSKLKINDNRDSSKYNSLPNAISGGGGWWSSYGGIVTSIEDFYILSSMLLNYGSYNGTRILKEETVNTMILNQIGSLDAYGNKYGLGVGVITSKEKPNTTEEIFWAGAPYNTYFWIDYNDNVIGILFTNTAPFGHLEMMDKFKELTEKTMIK
jgi:CubicO group peptidase (beta-lactamase class C family)